MVSALDIHPNQMMRIELVAIIFNGMQRRSIGCPFLAECHLNAAHHPCVPFKFWFANYPDHHQLRVTIQAVIQAS